MTNGYEGDTQEHMLDRKSVLTTLSYFKQLYWVVVPHFDEKNKLCSQVLEIHGFVQAKLFVSPGPGAAFLKYNNL